PPARDCYTVFLWLRSRHLARRRIRPGEDQPSPHPVLLNIKRKTQHRCSASPEDRKELAEGLVDVRSVNFVKNEPPLALYRIEDGPMTKNETGAALIAGFREISSDCFEGRPMIAGATRVVRNRRGFEQCLRKSGLSAARRPDENDVHASAQRGHG